MPTLSLNTPVTVAASGAFTEYTMASAGVLSFKGWGAGGAGGVRPAAPAAGPGGGGAYIAFDIPVAAGDIIKLEVGGGGKVATSTAAGGLGGWPDGGQGGLVTVADYSSSGGGGSTRVYKNGTLVGVAAGGGGGAGWTGGAGGALVGQQGGVGESKNFGSGAISGTTVCGTGGTQSAGGIAPQRSAETIPTGTSLQGGRGWSDTGNNNNTTGGGGGGGYFGGGGGSATTAGVQPGGGGGSSYIAPTAFSPVMWAGLGQISADPSSPSIGRGGNAAASWAASVSGGGLGADGQAYLLLTPVSTLPADTRTVLTGTAAAQYYTVPSAGTIFAKLWGGGGGGCALPAGGGGIQGEPGGTGGNATIAVPVTAGQIIRFDVGGGGAGATWTSGVSNGTMVGRGGDGGWPDGGAGGFNVNVIAGGGGGSSRVWIDGVLYALAAGGGGDGVGQTDRRPGSGGGLIGQDTTNNLAGYQSGKGTGGTQTAGGTNLYFPTDPYMAGAYLRGGRGYQVGASQNVNSDSCGGGGGGGYYGGGAGGGGNTATASAGGAGGSSYVKPGFRGTVDGGNQHIYAGGQDDVEYTTGVAMGGAASTLNSTAVAANAAPGANGQIIFTLVTNQTLVSGTKTTVAPTGLPKCFVAPSTGVLKVKMWGGGGAAGTFSTTTSGTVPGTYGGGCGGFTYAEIPVVAGQVVQFDVAKGAGATTYSSGATGAYTGIAGPGGWPDGGAGGMNVYLIPGGGGGSSRVWVDGVLKAVAGGGGGSSGDNRNFAGGGGGLQGQAITNSVNAPNGQAAFGGTQTAGGFNNAKPADLKATGSYLRGGVGYVLNGNRAAHNDGNGYGGGGGYYGGAGGGQSPNYVTGAAGGSSFLAPDVTGYTQAGNYGFNSGGSTDPDYVANVGKGSLLAANANGNPAYDGSVVYTFTPAANIPQNADNTVTAVGTTEYKVTTAGDLVVRLWGAGGGGSVFSTSTGVPGAGGGYTSVTVPVTVGQVVRFDVGKGGQGGQWTSGSSGSYVGRGGDGGWPDGGPGGYAATTLAGGGGGSSRVWIDGKLVAVAGGGGGSGAGVTTAQSGAGGGTAGGTSTNTTGVNTFVAGGGGQIAGGVNTQRPFDALATGHFLRAGQGYPTNESQTIASVNAGGGGGGGYYAGAGGGAGASIFTAGGGGAGFVGQGYAFTADSGPVLDKTVLYSSFNQVIEDDLRRSSGYKTYGAAAISATQSKFGGKSLYLNGTGSFVSTYLPNAFGTQDYTIEGWFKNESLTGAAFVLFGLGESASGGVTVFQYFNGNVYLRHTGNDVAVPWTPDLNWNHWAVSRVNGITRLFKNGVVLATQTTTFNLTAQTLILGSYFTTGSGESFYNGWVDDVRILNGIGLYPAAFTPPTAPYMTLATGATATGTTTAGTAAGVPGNTVASGYIAGKGVGGASRSTNGNATDGGDGLIVFNMPGAGDANATGLLPTVTLSAPQGVAVQTLNLPAPGLTTTQVYTGATVSYQAATNGTYFIEMWGAGGGGVSANNRGGGGGGYTTYEVSLIAGDVVTVQAPSGGGGGANAGSPAGAGGYPDGGNGFLPAFTQFQGGGGGSSRLYINGTLAAVAGGGGGGAYGSAGSDFQGGAGGGSSGLSGGATGGGTQSAGGAAAGNGLPGAYLQGGNGGVTSGVANNGPGGGGGYYGGGGGSNGGSGAGGGSGFFDTTNPRYMSGSTTAGSGNLPGGTGSVNYVSGTGTGSTGGNLAGGTGRITIYNNTPTPGNAAGGVGTVTVVPPVGGVDAGFPFPRTIGTITMSVGDAVAGIAANATGLLPTVIVNVPSADPRAQAIVSVPFNNNTSILLSAPTNEPFSIPAAAEGDLSEITLSPPLAQGQVPNAAEGDIGTIVVTSVDGEAESNLKGDASGDIGTIVLTEVKTDVLPVANLTTVNVVMATGVPHGGVLMTDDLPTITVTAPEAEGTVSAVATGETPLVYVTAPEAVIITDISHVYAPIGMVRVIPPKADLLIISDDNFIVEDLPGPITITEVPLAEAGTDVTASANVIIPAANAENPFPEERFMFRIFTAPPAAALEVDLDFEAYTGDLIVLVQRPSGETNLSANVNVAMPNPIVINGADAEVSLDITKPLSDNDIIVTVPDVAVDYGYGVTLPTVTIVPPQGSAQIAANASGDIGTITLENPRYHYIPRVNIVAPEGAAVGYTSASVEVGMPPPIVVSNLEGGSQTSATVSLPIPQVFVLPPEPFVVANSQATGAATPPIVVTPPASVVQIPGTAEGAIGTINLVAPEGFAGVAADASGDLFTIVVTPPAPDAFTGEANVSAAIATIIVTPPAAQGQVPGSAVGEALPPIVLTPAEGFVTTGAINADGDIATITVSAPEGVAAGQGLGSGGLGTITVASPRFTHIPQVAVTPPEALAGVAANATGDLVTITVNPPEASATGGVTVDLSTPLVVTLTPPLASASAGADIVTAEEITVLVIPPQATLFKEANVVVGFPTVFVYAPAATAMSLTEFPTIKVTPPDAYVDVPLPEGKARLRYKRTVVRGRAPASLHPREINLNETDGVLYSRNAAGDVVGTPLGQLTAAGLPPVATQDGKVLSANGVWADPAPLYTTPVRNAPPAGERIALAEGVTALTTFTPTVGALYTRPFFVARAIEIAALSVEVISPAAASAQLAIIGWSLAGVAGATLASGAVSTSTSGIKQAANTAVTLTPGWYAATFQVTGAAGASFRAATAPATLTPDLTAIASAPACVMADLEA